MSTKYSLSEYFKKINEKINLNGLSYTHIKYFCLKLKINTLKNPLVLLTKISIESTKCE